VLAGEETRKPTKRRGEVSAWQRKLEQRGLPESAGKKKGRLTAMRLNAKPRLARGGPRQWQGRRKQS